LSLPEAARYRRRAFASDLLSVFPANSNSGTRAPPTAVLALESRLAFPSGPLAGVADPDTLITATGAGWIDDAAETAINPPADSPTSTSSWTPPLLKRVAAPVTSATYDPLP
jgi:hypothetical protein